MNKKKGFMRMSFGEKVFVSVNYIFVALCFVATLYPLIYVISASFSDPVSVTSGKMILWPIQPSLEGYKLVFEYKDVWTGYANTIFYTGVGTLLNLVVTLPCAYALSRKDLLGRNIIMMVFLVTMYINGGLIPTYLNINDMGLVNTRAYMLLNGLLSVYNLIVARTFFANTIPGELQEAAFLDGCSNVKLFLKIIIPLSSPVIVVLALYYGIAHWNQYFNAMIYLKDRNLFPLQVFLKEILIQSSASADLLAAGGMSAEELEAMEALEEAANRMKYGIIVVSAAPMLMVYPWLQKFFAKGVMIGSVKG